jgi:hypothetical protein
MFDHLDGVMRTLAKKNEWKEDLFFTVKLARQKHSKYYSEVSPITVMGLISTQILDPCRTSRCLRKWDLGMDINPLHETSYTTQYNKVFLKTVENECYAKYGRVPVNKLKTVTSSNLVPSA